MEAQQVVIFSPSHWLLLLVGAWVTGTSGSMVALIRGQEAIRSAMAYVLLHGGAYPLPTPTQTALAHNLAQQSSDLAQFLTPAEISALAGAAVTVFAAIGLMAERIILAIRGQALPPTPRNGNTPSSGGRSGPN